VSNIKEFAFTQSADSYMPAVVVGAKIDDNSEFFTAPPTGANLAYYPFYGRFEKFITDYNANSEETALEISRTSQGFMRVDVDILMVPDYYFPFSCGDRVAVKLSGNSISGFEKKEWAGRIDRLTYTKKDGYLESRFFVNFQSPIKRTTDTGLLQTIGAMKDEISSLDKKYFNS